MAFCYTVLLHSVTVLLHRFIQKVFSRKAPQPHFIDDSMAGLDMLLSRECVYTPNLVSRCTEYLATYGLGPREQGALVLQADVKQSVILMPP